MLPVRNFIQISTYVESKNAYLPGIIIIYGGPTWNRTKHLTLIRGALYQLSYRPMKKQIMVWTKSIKKLPIQPLFVKQINKDSLTRRYRAE